jgi:Ca-activated chloride channel family protein
MVILLAAADPNVGAPIADAEMLLVALAAATAAAILATLGEWRHARRIARVARLAFGAEGRPAAWTAVVPIARVAGLALAAFGATLLLLHDPIESDDAPDPRASRQVLVVLDASPSMNIADAGPSAEKEMRGVWAGKVLRGILDRLDMKDTRISLVAFYTKALPVLRDTTDKNIVSELMDGLPLYTAFVPGETDMQAGLDAAFAMAKGWAHGSTTLVVISDGDLAKPVAPRDMPASIADALVIGVGDPVRPTILAGHASKQDAWMLKALAGKLGGHYHDGNARHLPREIVERLASIAPRVGDSVSLRELGLATLGAGAALTALIGPALLLLGRRAHVRTAARPRGGTAASSGAPGAATTSSIATSAALASTSASSGPANVPTFARASIEGTPVS